MKTALVTGGSAGIGKHTVRALVARGFAVLIAARDERKGRALVDALRASHPGAQVDFFSLDLSEPDDVRALAREVRSRWDHVDALVLNAGLFTPKLHTNRKGYEFMFATTHLGHFLLTHELLPLVKASADGRIVVTSSVAHFVAGRFDFKTLRQPSTSTALLLAPFLAYGRSKLANLLFVRELARRLAGTRVKVNAFHPGSVKTEIWRGTPGLFNTLIAPTLISEEQGAQTQIHLATEPGLTETGQYWYRKTIHRGSPASRRPDLAQKLWQYSEAALKIRVFGEPEPTTQEQRRQA